MNYKAIAEKQKELMKIKDRIYTIKLQLEGYTEVQSYSQSYRRLSNEEDNLHEKEIKIESELTALESEKDVTAEEILKKHKNWEVGISDADCIQAMEQYSQLCQRGEVYEREFVEWIVFGDQYFYPEGENYTWVRYLEDGSSERLYDINELHDFWLKEVKPLGK
jgi:hypothetical protein